MKRGTRPELMWAIGLTPADEKAIVEASGPDYHLRAFEAHDVPDVDHMTRQNPCLVWVSADSWDELDEDIRAYFEEWDIQRVLVLGPHEHEMDEIEFEQILETGFLTGIRQPLTREKVLDVLRRAGEIKSLYNDIFRMTKEIMLERELLTRKTDQLMFLNRILTRATESLDPQMILSRAREDMNMLVPVQSLSAIFWQPGETEEVEAELFLSPLSADIDRDRWIGYLLESAGKLTSKPVTSFNIDQLPSEDEQPVEAEHEVVPTDTTVRPDDSRVVLLPLRSGLDYFGCIALTIEDGHAFAKDQVQTIRSAINHLALALRNALLYRQVKTRADFDALTRIHNRASFDERLLEELKRHQRGRDQLAVLLLDLDHFKDVNDTWGHQAGDEVLTSVGRVLGETVRGSDFCARYGGEEFAVILPQTGEDDAWRLAERIREAIGKLDFQSGEERFAITASIGIGSLIPGGLSRVEELVCQADQALYAAKRGGRNMVCGSKDVELTAGDGCSGEENRHIASELQNMPSSALQ